MHLISLILNYDNLFRKNKCIFRLIVSYRYHAMFWLLSSLKRGICKWYGSKRFLVFSAICWLPYLTISIASTRRGVLTDVHWIAVRVVTVEWGAVYLYLRELRGMWWRVLKEWKTLIDKWTEEVEYLTCLSSSILSHVTCDRETDVMTGVF